MGNTVKKIINFRFNQYRDIEKKLEHMAAQGLFLTDIGSTLWTFRKGAPKKVKYTVTYFSEASLFNPAMTENQQTYFAYAEESGWKFVAQFNQMQIFVNEEENPVPFETDEGEKLANIKKCMRKNFVPSTVVLIVVFLLNLCMQIDSWHRNPIDFFARDFRVLSLVTMGVAVAYFVYILVSYFVWCKRSAKSIEMGGSCAENTGTSRKTLDVVVVICLIACLLLTFFDIAKSSGFLMVIFGFVQIPILVILLRITIALLKKKRCSAQKNRIISFGLLILGSFAYAFLVVLLIAKVGIPSEREKPHSTVAWELSSTETRNYTLYQDDIPLTCEELYGDLDDPYYSYEEHTDDSVLLTRHEYRQSSPPAKDAPPSLAYTILKPKFDFVYDIAAKDLLKLDPDWEERTKKPIDNALFGTEAAYQTFFSGDGTGEYLLLYQDTIVQLDLEEPATETQIGVILKELALV